MLNNRAFRAAIRLYFLLRYFPVVAMYGLIFIELVHYSPRGFSRVEVALAYDAIFIGMAIPAKIGVHPFRAKCHG
jgi:hypothetical protein